MKESKDIFGDPLPKEMYTDKYGNPTNIKFYKHCPRHGWNYFTTTYSPTRQKRKPECPKCHGERTTISNRRKKLSNGIITEKLRKQMVVEHRGKDLACPICGRKEKDIPLYTYGRTHPWHIDHIDPAGGLGDNLRVICQECNTKKCNKVGEVGEVGTLEFFFEISLDT